MKTSMTKAITAILLLATVLMISCTGTPNKEVKEPRIGIHEATFMGNTKAVQDHIDFGSDLNIKDAYGSTPLNIAITFGKTEVAKLLIEGGADLTIKSADGSTVLHTASFFGRTEVVEAILDKGIDTQIRNSYGSTAGEALMAPFDQVRVIYDQLSRDLGPLGLKLDYDAIKESRPVIAEMITEYENAQ